MRIGEHFHLCFLHEETKAEEPGGAIVHRVTKNRTYSAPLVIPAGVRVGEKEE